MDPRATLIVEDVWVAIWGGHSSVFEKPNEYIDGMRNCERGSRAGVGDLKPSMEGFGGYIIHALKQTSAGRTRSTRCSSGGAHSVLESSCLRDSVAAYRKSSVCIFRGAFLEQETSWPYTILGPRMMNFSA